MGSVNKLRAYNEPNVANMKVENKRKTHTHTQVRRIRPYKEVISLGAKALGDVSEGSRACHYAIRSSL